MAPQVGRWKWRHFRTDSRKGEFSGVMTFGKIFKVILLDLNLIFGFDPRMIIFRERSYAGCTITMLPLSELEISEATYNSFSLFAV